MLLVWLFYVLCVIFVTIKLVGPAYYRAEMYAGRVACCRLVSLVKYAPPCAPLTLEKKMQRALIRLEKKMGQTDGRTLNQRYKLVLKRMLLWSLFCTLTCW